MRPGLGQSGALPLLVLVGFLLATLVPSLSGVSSLKLADWSCFTGGASQLPLIQDGGATFPPDTAPAEPFGSWSLSTRSHSRAKGSARAPQAPDGPVESRNIIANENDSRLPYPASKPSSPFLFGKRARAFRTYFIQHLDDYQLFTSFANRTPSAASTLTPPSPITSSHAVPLPTLIDDNERLDAPNEQQDRNLQTPTRLPEERTAAGLQLPSLCDRWQLACQIARDLWADPHKFVSAFWMLASTGLELSTEPQTKAREVESDMDGVSSKGASAVNSSLEPSSQTHISPLTTNDQTTDAAGSTAELRGSCMAVVIGLVAGIMWF
ncbi:hypothetical protein PDE_07252 [Penicillium oxalicum 114-2]|uniref:Uncharacterized protein n=2 Tax=Penicillium oxalicum TaxID=69781 RepID=S8BBP1_PENO1|nr:hypothetical protein PDE_07252 [Penicillium oxalicum 114-2]